MAVFGWSHEQIERAVSRSTQLRTRYLVAATVVLSGTVLLWYYDPALPIFHRPTREWTISLLAALFVHPVIDIVRGGKGWRDRKRAFLRETKLEITPDSVTAYGPSGYKRQLCFREIVRVDEPLVGAGLYLRSSNRYRWILIPRKIAGYDVFKDQLKQQGLAPERTLITNWEEYILVLWFVGTLFCTLIVRNKSLLFLNLLVSILTSISGFLIIGANPDNPKIRNARIGIFIPAVFAAISYFFR